ncbi:MAG: LptF/LptG family permease [Verrucomicrobia bacterium]|jgi:lipopolysaccharide export system permease protein|nr:LptF/LptG family permease [Verrucomicrobiota bacterium]
MRLLDRYLLRELMTPLSFCLGGFFLFWISFDLFSELDDFQERGVGLARIAWYYLLESPSFLRLVLPMGLLLAMLYTLTRHARHNEITAIRAAGISLGRLCLPYLAVGVGCSLTLFALNERWAPEWSARAQQIRSASPEPGDSASSSPIARQLGFENTRDGRRWMIERYDVEHEVMYRPQVHWYGADGRQRSVYAEQGVYTNGTWLFLNAREYLDAGLDDRLLQPTRLTNVLDMTMLNETPAQIRSEVWISKRLSRLSDTKEADVPLSVILNYLRLHPQPDRRISPWIHTMLHARLASPWTCLVVVLIAIPFAGATGRQNLFVGVASSIGICFAFFVLEQFSIALGAGGHLPPWLAAWLPNLAFSSLALGLILRIR